MTDPRFFTPYDGYMMDPYNYDQQDTKTKATAYTRYPKPPYTYLGIAVMSIELSPRKALTLSGIFDAMYEMFPFFRSSYIGWKASLRHTLSKYDCFVRKENGEWSVDLTKVQSSAFRRQDTIVARQGNYACDLHRQLNVPRVKLPSDIQNMPTSKFDSSSDSSEAMSPKIVVDGSPEKPTPKIDIISLDSGKKTEHVKRPDPSVTRAISSCPRITVATSSSAMSSAPPVVDHYMKKSPVWSTEDAYQPFSMTSSQFSPSSTSERSSCMQNYLPSFNSFFAGTAQDISPSLSPMWNNALLLDDDCDNSFSQRDMPDLTPAWKILSQPPSTDASSDYRPTTSPIFTDLTAPVSTSTPVEKRAKSTLRLPLRPAPENQTTKFLMDDILGERDGPADRPCTAKSTSPTQSSPSSSYLTVDTSLAVDSQSRSPDCQHAEFPTTLCSFSSKLSSCQMLSPFMTNAPGKTLKRKRTKPARKMSRSDQADHRPASPSTLQTYNQTSAMDNLQRLCQNYNVGSVNPYNPSFLNQQYAPVPATFGHGLPASSATPFHYPQQHNYVDFPCAGYYNQQITPYQGYPSMHLSQDASGHVSMFHPYLAHAYSVQRPDMRPMDLSSTRNWVTQ